MAATVDYCEVCGKKESLHETPCKKRSNHCPMEVFPKKWGLAFCDPETRKRVARSGGKNCALKTGHMAKIGKKGGTALSQDREYMAKIGRIGGKNRNKKTKNQ